MRSAFLALPLTLIGGSVFGLGQVGSGQPKDIPPPQACYKMPGDQLCSDLPHDVLATFGTGYDFITEAGQRPFDNFSWQMFVGLNWPADDKGHPLPKPIGSAPKAPAKVNITPNIAKATFRRFSSPMSLPTGFAACGGSVGRLTHCQIKFTTVIGTSAQKMPRQPIMPPI